MSYYWTSLALQPWGTGGTCTPQNFGWGVQLINCTPQNLRNNVLREKYIHSAPLTIQVFT